VPASGGTAAVDLFCQMLRRIASALQAFAARHDGFAARYDGEEFTLLFAVDTETKARKIRSKRKKRNL